MDALDEMKEKWSAKNQGQDPYNATDMSRVIRKRVSNRIRESMKYFWASFALQILVYALYTHVIVRFIYDPFTVMMALAGMLIFIPFTYRLMKKFKQIARLAPDDGTPSSVRDYIVKQQGILREFFRFKRRYEWLLIPLSTILGTLLLFKIYVPGGPMASPNGVWITMVITLASCYYAIYRENQKSFIAPLAELDKLLHEFSEENSDQPAAL